MAAFAWWATSLEPFTWLATVVVVAGGLAAFRWGWHHCPPWRMSPRAMALCGAIAVWELNQYRQHPRSEHPTLSSMANRLLDSQPQRTAGFVVWLALAALLARRRSSPVTQWPLCLGWLWVGWHLFARASLH